MTRFLLAIAALALFSAPASAHEGHSHGTTLCAEASLKCASTATPLTAPDGGLFLTWSAGGQVSVARSHDNGASFAPAVLVSGPPATIDDGGEARPKMFADTKGNMFVTWTTRRDKGYVGTVWLARSTDGGQTFSPPKALSDDGTSQRFETLGVTKDGKMVALWVDKRAAAKTKAYGGADLVASWSDDNGASFGANKIVMEHSCECCRLGLAAAPDGSLVAMWRQLYAGGVRDHAAATLTPAGLGPIQRVAVDDWKIDGCPHHGPAVAVDKAGTWHMAWFTNGRARQGLFYARSTDGGTNFSAPRALGNADNQPGHPSVLVVNDQLFLAWKEFDGEHTSIMAQSSPDGGASWGEAHRVAATKDASDHPLLVAVNGQPRLSWLTRAEGWRLLPVSP